MQPRLPGTAVIALSSLFFAAMAVLSRTLAGRVPAAEQVVVRHAIGLAVIALVFAARRQVPVLKRPGLLALRGVLGGGAVLAYFVAIERLGAAPATVLNYISPVFAALWAAAFLGERPSRTMFLGLVLATGGAALVTLASGDFTTLSSSAVGALAGLASALLGGAAMATVKAAREDADAFTIFLAFSVLGLAMGVPFAAAHWVPLGGAELATGALIGALAVAGQLLFTWGMGHTTATAGSATTQLVPVFAWTMAIGLLGEPVRPLAFAGALLCVAGVLVGVVRRGNRAS